MKGTCALLASAMAASTLALSSSFSPQHQFNCISAPATTIPSSVLHQRAAPSAVKDRQKIWPAQHASGGNKFAPKFDGLRFIETLVTAHR